MPHSIPVSTPSRRGGFMTIVLSMGSHSERGQPCLRKIAEINLTTKLSALCSEARFAPSVSWNLFLFGLLLVMASGCASTGSQNRVASRTGSPSSTNITALSVYHHEPKVQIKSGRKWNPVFWFGNEDEPIPPEDYRPDDPNRRRKWYFRNPCHNFTFYVIGIADEEFDQTGCYPGEVFNPNGGWNWTVCRHNCWRLPFLSYRRGGFQFYCGWRERGNFGMKLRF